MFFIASKIFHFLIDPLNGILVALWVIGYALWTSKLRLARFVTTTLLIMVMILGYDPIPHAFLSRLESQIPKTTINLSQVQGIIVLGGAVLGGILPIERDEVVLNESAARMTKTVELAHKFPHLQIIFTGFSGECFPTGISEAGAAERFFVEQGIEPNRIRYEARARNTYENALFTRALLQGSQKPWILLTSASHMYRSFLIFSKLGLPTIPFPVSYQTTLHTSWFRFNLNRGVKFWKILIHEIIGLIVYRLTGKL